MTTIGTVVIPADVSSPNAPKPAEAVTASTSLKDKFGGDTNKLASSYDAAETELGVLRAKIAELSKPKEEVVAPKEGDDLLAIPKPKDTAAKAAADALALKAKDKVATPEEMDKAAVETAKAAGLDYDALSKKFTANGKLDDADFAAFAKIGIPRSYVEQYLADGVVAQEARTAAALTSSGFTSETFAVAAKWAGEGKGLTDPELKAFNDAVNSPDPARQKQALAFLNHKHELSQGKAPKLMDADGGAPGGVIPYASKAQWQAEINDPRYSKDPAWRAQVVARLGVSPNLI